MSNEEFYDKEIAPMLLELCRKCQERGMAFIASVEYDPLSMGRGTTEFCPPDDGNQLSAAQRLVHWASRSQGNIDRLFMACDRHGRENGHSSMYLRLFGNDNVKYTGAEVAALTVIGPKAS